MIKVKNEIYIKALGKRIQKLRRDAGISQEELSNISEVSLAQITRIERGTINPTVSTIYALSKGLGIKTNKIYDFEISDSDK